MRQASIRVTNCKGLPPNTPSPQALVGQYPPARPLGVRGRWRVLASPESQLDLGAPELRWRFAWARIATASSDLWDMPGP